MKIYCFYRFDKSLKKKDYQSLISAGVKLNDIHQLYACTVKKKFVKKFIDERDMNQFVYIERDGDREEVISYLNRHASEVLDYRSYIHYPYIKDFCDMAIDVKILSTLSERNIVDMIVTDGVLNTELFTARSNPYILKQKYLTALTILDYVSIFKLTSNTRVYHGSDDSYDYPEAMLDEFLVFIRQFSKVFK